MSGVGHSPAAVDFDHLHLNDHVLLTVQKNKYACEGFIIKLILFVQIKFMIDYWFSDIEHYSFDASIEFRLPDWLRYMPKFHLF